jgi:hypothetical protein
VTQRAEGDRIFRHMSHFNRRRVRQSQAQHELVIPALGRTCLPNRASCSQRVNPGGYEYASAESTRRAIQRANSRVAPLYAVMVAVGV